HIYSLECDLRRRGNQPGLADTTTATGYQSGGSNEEAIETKKAICWPPLVNKLFEPNAPGLGQDSGSKTASFQIANAMTSSRPYRRACKVEVARAPDT